MPAQQRARLVVAQLAQVVGTVRPIRPVHDVGQPAPVGGGEDQRPARPQHARELVHARGRVGEVLDQLAREEAIEARVTEGQRVRPLAQAAQSCFGKDAWPKTLPVPHSWLEFDVEDVAAASQKLQHEGYMPLVSSRKEPWGQTVTRLLSPEGILVGVTYTPSMRKKKMKS